MQIEEKLLKEELKGNNPVRLRDLAINGNDLIEMGISEGEKIGSILWIIFKKVLTNPESNNKKYLLELARHIISDNSKKKKI